MVDYRLTSVEPSEQPLGGVDEKVTEPTQQPQLGPNNKGGKRSPIIFTISIIGGILVLIIAIFIVFQFPFISEKTTVEDETETENVEEEGLIACTLDAKVCPDGSTVGRTAPDCEFRKCPKIPIQTDGWKTYTGIKDGIEFRYPETLASDFFNLQKPQLIVTSQEEMENIDNSCYTGVGLNPIPLKIGEILINDMSFCLSETYNTGSGTGTKYFFYTIYKDASYFTIAYAVTQPNSCSNYGDTPNLQLCEVEMAQYSTLVEDVISESISTFKFTK